MKKSSFLLIVAFLLLFGLGLGYAYYYSQDNFAIENTNEIEREIISVRNQIDNLQKSDVVAAQKALEVLEKISGDEIMWSEVLRILLRIVPLDVEERRPLVNFISFSGAQEGRLAFNAQTNPSTNVRRQLSAVATIVRTFNDSQVFYNAFVPSISKSVTGEDESVLSFILNVNYTNSVLDEKEESSEPVSVN